MYQSFANQNPLINQFNGYVLRNQNMVPFQNNRLISNNVHVMNHLNDYIQQYRIIQQKIPLDQKVNKPDTITVIDNSQKNTKSKNIIEEILKPQKIIRDNKDVEANYRARKKSQKQSKKGNINIKITNVPYKNIIKDKIITKKVEDVTVEDLIVHRSQKEIDADREKFEKELKDKNNEMEKINEELKIEFNIENYDKHKKKFEYKESFIKNLAFEQSTFDENKQDYINFYQRKQKEAEEGKKICDQILHSIMDEGIVNRDELPTDTSNLINV